MRLVVLSDIHSNFDSLSKVIQEEGENCYYCSLGDVIDYHQQPLECLELLKNLWEKELILADPERRKPAIIRGNHEYSWEWVENHRFFEDILKLSDEDVSRLNEIALYLWKEQPVELPELNKDAMNSLVKNLVKIYKNPELAQWYLNLLKDYDGKFKIDIEGWQILMTHGMLDNPYESKLTSKNERYVNSYIKYFETILSEKTIILHGHTHEPIWFHNESLHNNFKEFGVCYSLSPGIHLINPGSVGVSRNGYPKSYAVLELDNGEATVTFYEISEGGE